MSDLSIVQNVIYLQGEVSFKTVTRLNQQLHTLMQPQVLALDCSGVTKVDSSIAALLLAAIKIARATGMNFSITQPPETVCRLAKLYDLEEYFGDNSLPAVTKK